MMKKKKNDQKNRKCLKCQKSFLSEFKHNRLCYNCKVKIEELGMHMTHTVPIKE